MPLVAVTETGTFPDVTLTDLPGNSHVGVMNNSSAAVKIPIPGTMAVLGGTAGGIEPSHAVDNNVITLQPHSHVVMLHVSAGPGTVEFDGMVTTHKTAAAASAGRGTSLYIQPLTGGATWTAS